MDKLIRLMMGKQSIEGFVVEPSVSVARDYARTKIPLSTRPYARLAIQPILADGWFSHSSYFHCNGLWC